MDHSIRGYLSRRPTEVLEQLLLSHLEHPEPEISETVIRSILDILREREEAEGPAASPEV